MTTAPPYQPIEGCDTPALQPCIERWEMMQPFLPNTPGRMIDFGCHTGWFCRQFARAGWQAFGIDRSTEWIEIAMSLNNGLESPPLYLTDDIFKMSFPKVDVALCLSLAMYLFDDLSRIDRLDLRRGWNLFRLISEAAPMMFMDFGGMYSNRLPFTEGSVIEQMLANTRYTSGRLVGRTAFESRPFYIFER